MCMCIIYAVRREIQVGQLIYDSMINLRVPSKYQKDKSRLRVIEISYQTQDIEHNYMQENQIVEWNKPP